MIHIQVAYANLNQQVEIFLSVEESCTLAIAIRRSGILDFFPEIDLATAIVGIYGSKRMLDDLAHDEDRVEIYRPLLVDPKQARKIRAKKSQ